MILDKRLLERLTASDLFLLQWDPYGWSSDIGGLAILDGRDNCPDVEVLPKVCAGPPTNSRDRGPVSATDDDAVGQRSRAQSVGEAAVGGGG